MTRPKADKAVIDVAVAEVTASQSQQQKKTRAPGIKWIPQDTAAIVDWFCQRDENGVPRNYEDWSTSNHTDVSQRMLQETGLIHKDKANKETASDKMKLMIKNYNDVRTTAEGSGWC